MLPNFLPKDRSSSKFRLKTSHLAIWHTALSTLDEGGRGKEKKCTLANAFFVQSIDPFQEEHTWLHNIAQLCETCPQRKWVSA